jgi:hypothetical protein
MTIMSRPIDNCYWVLPGKLLAGEYPRNLDDASSPQKIARLTDAGITAFIDLTEENALSPYAQWLDTASHQRVAITDASVPSSLNWTVEILETIVGISTQTIPFTSIVGAGPGVPAPSSVPGWPVTGTPASRP